MPDGGLARAPVNRVARGSVVAFIIYGLGIGLTYCSQLVIARFIGADAYGVYAYVLAWVTVLAYFSTFGLEVALLRFLPTYEAEHKWSLFRGAIQYAERRAAIIGISVTMIGICFIMLRGLSGQLRNTFLIGLTIVPVLALLWIRCSIVRAFGGVASAIAPDRVVRDGVLVGIVTFASFGLSWRLDAATAMAATLMSAVMGLAVASLAVRRRYPDASSNSLPNYDLPAWRQAAVPLVIIGAAEALMNRTGVILLGWIGDTKAAGVYSLAFNIAFVVALPRIAVNTLLAPAISGVFACRNEVALRALITSAASWTLASAGAIALVLYVLADPLLAWFGPDYERGVPAIRILLIGQLIVAGAGSQLHVMTMTGCERSAAMVLVSSTIINAAINVALINFFGLPGAAAASSVTLVIWNLAMALFLWRRFSLLPGVLASHRFQIREKPSIQLRSRSQAEDVNR